MMINRLYAILAIACFFGYLWIGYSVYFGKEVSNAAINGCFIKQVTTMPCPSCGTTRAITLLLDGDFKASMLLNPLGIVMAFLLAVIPPWLVFDVVMRKQTLYNYYTIAEDIIKTKWIAIILVILITLNWIWNINKQL